MEWEPWAYIRIGLCIASTSISVFSSSLTAVCFGHDVRNVAIAAAVGTPLLSAILLFLVCGYYGCHEFALLLATATSMFFGTQLGSLVVFQQVPTEVWIDALLGTMFFYLGFFFCVLLFVCVYSCFTCCEGSDEECV
jgi:hypothetical protein